MNTTTRQLWTVDEGRYRLANDEWEASLTLRRGQIALAECFSPNEDQVKTFQDIAIAMNNHDALLEALRPFAALASHTEVLSNEMEIEGCIGNCDVRLTIGHLRKARAAIRDARGGKV